MNSSQPKPFQPKGFLPVLLVALAFITVQMGTILRYHTQLRALKDQTAQLERNSRTSRAMDAWLESLLSNLPRLTAMDNEAKTIAAKYGLELSPSTPLPAPGR